MIDHSDANVHVGFPSKKIVILSILLIIFSGFAVYANTLHNKFIWDDVSLVEKNVYTKKFSNLPKIFATDMMAGAGKRSNYYRPLQISSYMVDYALWKLDPKGYHLTSTVVHVCAALSLYWLVNIIFQNNFLSLLTGMLFVVHPVHTEAVTYVSGRADPLALLFMLLCFVSYLKSLSSGKIGPYFLMVLSYTLALLSRENSLVLPVLLLLYHYSFKKKIKAKEILSVAGVTFAYIFFRVAILKVVSTQVDRITTLSQRIPGFFVAVTNYIKLLFLPLGLHMEYGTPLFHWGNPKAILGVALLIALITYAVRKKDDDPLVFFAISWFLVGLLPVANLFPINAYMAEHWLYVPSIGFFLIFAKTIHALFKAKAGSLKMFSIAFALSALVFYSYLTVKQNTYWREPIDFYNRALKYAPDSAEVYDNLGVAYNAANRKEEAVKAYERAIQIDPDYAGAHNNLGAAYNLMNRREEAVRAYKRALEIDPGYAEAYYNLGVVYYALGKKEEAIASYQKAIEIYPNYTGAYNNLGAVYYVMGKKEEAIASYRKAIEIDPHYAGAYNNLAVIYFYQQQYKLAIEYSDKATKLGYPNPDFLETLKPYR